jgi:hypothetical protein
MSIIHAPESNVENVALNLVYDAIVDDVNNTGEAVGALLDRMARIAREIGHAYRASNIDWNEEMSEYVGEDMVPGQFEQLIHRVGLTTGEAWAQYWMLTHLARNLCKQLEMICDNDPFAAHIESIEYEADGSVKSWSQRKL